MSCVLSCIGVRKSPGLVSRRLTSAPVNGYICIFTGLKDVSYEAMKDLLKAQEDLLSL